MEILDDNNRAMIVEFCGISIYCGFYSIELIFEDLQLNDIKNRGEKDNI